GDRPGPKGRGRDEDPLRDRDGRGRPVDAVERSEHERHRASVSGPLGGSDVAFDVGGGTRTTTSRMRSGGIEARITFAARVARKPSVVPGPFTVNTRVVPGAVALAA